MPDFALDAGQRLDLLLDSLEPFDTRVVHLRYRMGEQSLPRIAAALSSTTEQVAHALMGVYRRVTAVLETG